MRRIGKLIATSLEESKVSSARHDEELLKPTSKGLQKKFSTLKILCRDGMLTIPIDHEFRTLGIIQV